MQIVCMYFLMGACLEDQVLIWSGSLEGEPDPKFSSHVALAKNYCTLISANFPRFFNSSNVNEGYMLQM